jgi:sulfatase modifying factor 1
MDKKITLDLPGGIPLELILVEPGHFIMGSEGEDANNDEKPEHIVHITHPFYIGKYPVTQAQWQAVMGNNPSRFSGLQRPVEKVSWLDIVDGNQDKDGTPAFLTLVNNRLAEEKPKLAATHKFRLPTEAEWEYAAKGGPRYALAELEDKKAADIYPIYAGGDRLESCGWFNRNSNSETKPVGLKQANALGLYDMSGNVDEWCYDGRTEYADRKDEVTENPVGPLGGDDRVLRGGRSWDLAGYSRSTFRGRNDPPYRRGNFGFRLVLSPSSGSGTSG